MDTSEKYIKMCSLAQEIQQKWRFESGDFVYDPDLDEVEVWVYYHVNDPTEFIWLPRQDQLAKICIEFFMRIMYTSEFEAYLRFLDWYSGCLRDAYKHSLKNPNYGFINSNEEILLNEAMKMLHRKKWDGERWVKALKGYEPQSSSNLSMKTLQ